MAAPSPMDRTGEERSSSMILIILVGILEAIIIVGVLYFLARGKQSAGSTIVKALEKEIEDRRAVIQEIEGLNGQMVDGSEIARQVSTGNALREAIKVERGRVTITQAELETVEERLRDLEEIERELEASGVEAKEELRILNKKEQELSKKNDQLKEQLSASMDQLDRLMSELEGNIQAQTEIEKMRGELLRAQEQITTLLTEIEQMSEQYFVLKQRYDALDIEYAQLYEKFAA